MGRLTEFWNWLPVFRAVAETEHLPTAARQLAVSPSALSRTIQLLERAVGKPLFHREGRNLRLNRQGAEFLATVRDSMRLLDTGVTRLLGEAVSGRVRIALAGPYSTTVAPVVGDLLGKYPDVALEFHLHDAALLTQRILRGELDLGIVPDRVTHPRLVVDRLLELTSGVYCGKGHPLFRSRRPTLQRILLHPFAAPVSSPEGLPRDGWPAELDRTVAVYLEQLQVALDLCASGQVLALFPDRVADASPLRARLRRLPPDVIPPVWLYTIKRRRLQPADPLDDLLDDLIEKLRLHWSKA